MNWWHIHFRDNPFEIITILLDSRSNVVFDVLTALHGSENVSNVSLKTIVERPFGLYDLVGKDCNLDAEMSSGVIKNITILKKIKGSYSYTAICLACHITGENRSQVDIASASGVTDVTIRYENIFNR